MTETEHVCRICGMNVEHVDAMPDFGIEAAWVHRRGQWRVPADHAGAPAVSPPGQTPGGDQ